MFGFHQSQQVGRSMRPAEAVQHPMATPILPRSHRSDLGRCAAQKAAPRETPRSRGVWTRLRARAQKNLEKFGDFSNPNG